ncbi:hypothetical protein OH76DRAFT_1395883 [Lentinus brumalis]|uniref:Uncharacterized protein n=1 Tax=Lentinus brumalis TaxID=2498619 RepID=A0A371DW27_9APHY|nr:hypothetical protein OH76DRAFT_1395883 [Polyporus brumalis]
MRCPFTHVFAHLYGRIPVVLRFSPFPPFTSRPCSHPPVPQVYSLPSRLRAGQLVRLSTSNSQRMSRKPDPPFPSFTTMSREMQSDTLKLPAYRESYLLRFHPYPQTRRHDKGSSLMRTVDYRHAEPPVTQEAPEASNSLRDEVADFEHVVSEAEANAGRQHIKRKRSLTSLIIDFAFLLRYKWRSSTQASPGA